ncbi:hypothetical protein A0H81_01139 [Grifola frondosa]|uniref:Uncharacterized protein n=1 Tax=Grifola frondosa TaxID=5627 RepID=A0A1C7MSK1_GRIFR|nr:hypothetical protein A0H81_01139 [Grifola frondosa]
MPSEKGADNLASQASSQGCNSECQQQTLFTLSACQQMLSVLAADKGLANYDRNDEMETLLKDIVDFTKDLLKATVQIVYEVPVLGPLLGPSQ